MGRPKALLDYRGETFVDRLIRIFSKPCDPVIVVAGYHADAIRTHLNGHATLVINPDPARGQLSSLQTALAAVPATAEAFLFTPVDSPSVSEDTVGRLIDEFRLHPAPFVIPRFQGRRGHPVCAASSMIAEFLALPPTAETREIVTCHESQITYLDVKDPGVLADIDDLEAYRKLVS